MLTDLSSPDPLADLLPAPAAIRLALERSERQTTILRQLLRLALAREHAARQQRARGQEGPRRAE